MPMKNPPHPGDLIKTEIVSRRPSAVSNRRCRRRRRIPKVRRATLSDLLHGKRP